MLKFKEKKVGEMVCPKCGSENVQVQVVAEQKKRGCLATIGWLLLALCTLGLILIIPMIMHKGSKTVRYAVCQNCGKRWKL